MLAARAPLEHAVANEKVDEVTLQTICGAWGGIAETRHDIPQADVHVFALREDVRVAFREVFPNRKPVADPERPGIDRAQARRRGFLHHVHRERRTRPATCDAKTPRDEGVDAVTGDDEPRGESTSIARAQVDGLACLLGVDHLRAFDELGAGLARERDEQRIELDAANHQRRRYLRPQLHRVAIRALEVQARDPMRGDSREWRGQPRKARERTHADRAAARLVTGEPRAVEHERPHARQSQGARRRGTGGSGPDYDHIRGAIIHGCIIVGQRSSASTLNIRTEDGLRFAARTVSLGLDIS